jgi:hypothetical protein
MDEAEENAAAQWLVSGMGSAGMFWGVGVLTGLYQGIEKCLGPGRLDNAQVNVVCLAPGCLLSWCLDAGVGDERLMVRKQGI